MVLALAYGLPTLAAGIVWLLKPQWRGRRLLQAWLGIAVLTALPFQLMRIFVVPH